MSDSQRTDHQPTERQLLDACAGLLRVLKPGQEAILSSDQLAPLIMLARRGSNG